MDRCRPGPAGQGTQWHFSISTTAWPVRSLSQAGSLPCRCEPSTMSKEWLSSAKAVGSTHRARLQVCQPAQAVRRLSRSHMVTRPTWSLQSLAQQLHDVRLLSQAAV